MDLKTEKSYKARYEKFKTVLLLDTSICQANKDLFADFFRYQEVKLKRTNKVAVLDESSYKTLYKYIHRFRTVNRFFDNKPWKDLTKEDIERVYNDLEDNKITRENGLPYKDKSDFYDKVIKSKPFELVGKASLARTIILYTGKADTAVRFITEQDFRKLIFNASEKLHSLMLWLAYDYGENISSILRLKKSDFYKQENPDTNEQEYRVNFRKEILKRSRTPRSEINNYPETATLLDEYLPTISDDQYLFGYDYAQAKKILSRIRLKAEVRCIPGGEPATWKDLRSAMACDLLQKGWHTDEVNARLGHKPSSSEIDKYVNFLAIDRHKPKKKVQDYSMTKLKREVEEAKERERLYSMRSDSIKSELASEKAEREKLSKELAEIKKLIIANGSQEAVVSKAVDEVKH